MSPDLFAQVESAFHRILSLDPDARPKALGTLRTDLPEVADEVERLLHASAETWQLGEWGSGAIESDEWDEPPPPERIGSFRVVGELGRGGMGVVYLGERDDDEFHQRVAIKVVQRGFDAEMLGRLRRERQILATLDHPNVARLVDGGSTEDGRPFFAMDHIEGRGLLTWCDEQSLGVEERILLFLEVCAAVQYAHRNLVIHRDLKPSNILVTEDGVPKLLDFGIAKLLAAEAGDATRTGLVPMTPDYASPEQMLGEPLTTATDVYSLGVVLFELLAGRHPYGEQVGGQASLARLFDRSAKVPMASSLTDGKLARTLRGDLDNILAMALRREAERRYPSVADLAEDLRRYLDLRPVRAHPESLPYRIARFVRREKVLVAAGALVFTSLTVGIAGTTWQARKAERARAAAEQQTELAGTVSSYLVEIFGEPDPGKHLGNEPKASDLLARGRERLDDLDGQPEVQAELALVIGQAYQQLGDHAEALKLYRRCLELRQSLVDAPHSDLVETLIYLSNAESLVGEEKSAMDHLKDALDQQRKLPQDAATEAALLNDLGVNHFRRGEAEEAMVRLEEALQLRSEALGMEHVDTAQTLNNIASIRASRETPAEAIEPMRQALAIYETQLGSGHPSSLETRSNLAVTLFVLGQDAEAITTFEQLIRSQRRIYEDGHPHLGTNLNNLGWMILRSDAVDRPTLPIFTEAVDMLEATLGTDHEDYLRALVGRGRSYLAENRPSKAALDFRTALDHLSEDDSSSASLRPAALSGLGSSMAFQQQLVESAALLCEAVELRDSSGRSETSANQADREFLAKIFGEAPQVIDTVPDRCRHRIQ